MPDVENVQEVVPPTPCFVEEDVDAGEPALQTQQSIRAYVVLFLLTTAATAAFCIPSIVEGLQKLRSRPAVSTQVVEDHKAAQTDALEQMRELESAVQNPQGQ